MENKNAEILNHGGPLDFIADFDYPVPRASRVVLLAIALVVLGVFLALAPRCDGPGPTPQGEKTTTASEG